MKAEGFPVDPACAAAEVSTSAYYEWLQRRVGPTEAELDEAYLVNRIVDNHAESDSTHGSPRVTKELRRRGYCVNHKRTERLLSKHTIVGVTPRRRTPRTTLAAEGAPPLLDLVNQDFSPGEPDRGDGPATSPTSASTRARSTWTRCSIWGAAGWWAGPWTRPCRRRWWPMHFEWRQSSRVGDIAGVFHSERGSQTWDQRVVATSPGPADCRTSSSVSAGVFHARVLSIQAPDRRVHHLGQHRA